MLKFTLLNSLCVAPAKGGIQQGKLNNMANKQKKLVIIDLNDLSHIIVYFLNKLDCEIYDGTQDLYGRTVIYFSYIKKLSFTSKKISNEFLHNAFKDMQYNRSKL